MRYVLHIIDLLHTGGAQQLLVTFARESQKRSLRTGVVCLYTPFDSPMRSELARLGVPIFDLPAGKMLDVKRFWRLVKLLRSEKPDLIQTHLTYANILGGLAGSAAGIPVVATLHLAGRDKYYSAGRARLEGWVLRGLARRVLAVGARTAEANQRRVGSKPIEVLENAVMAAEPLTPAERTAARRALAGDENRPLLISVGRMSPQKAVPDLLKAFAAIHSRCPQAALLLAGDGEQRLELEAFSESLGLAGSVMFLGNRSDVPRLLSACDVYISASVVEGMPIAVMEAMMAGLPVVSTCVGDLPGMIGDDRGILVEPGKPGLLAEAALDLLADPRRMEAMGRRGKAYAEKQYSSAAWMDRLTGIYQEVLKRPGGRTE